MKTHVIKKSVELICGMNKTTYHSQFFTATIQGWKHLLKPDKYKDILVESFRFLVREQRLSINAFVIMSNHLHTIWQIEEGHELDEVQRDFLKFTAQQIKLDLTINHPKVLQHFRKNGSDREYQFWKRKSLSVDLYTEAVLLQKLNYIHLNPVKAGLCELPEDYHYSSAKFYYSGADDFGFLTHYSG